MQLYSFLDFYDICECKVHEYQLRGAFWGLIVFVFVYVYICMCKFELEGDDSTGRTKSL